MLIPSILVVTTAAVIATANAQPAGAEVAAGESLLHIFTSTASGGGAFPYSGLIADKAGVLYGTISDKDCSCSSYGAVFKLTRSASGYTYQTLYRFQGGSDGANPESTLVADRTGALYGTTVAGGGFTSVCAQGCGTVFKLTPSGSGYLEDVLYAFRGGSDGTWPVAPLILDKSGALYGTAPNGGSSNCDLYGCGTAFRLQPHGSGYDFSVIYTFLGRNDAANPVGGLVFGRGGVLYGTTSGGPGGGTAFTLTPNGSRYTETLIHHFLGGSDGFDPLAGLSIDPQGALYGTTAQGGGGGCGSIGCGIVFKLTPSGSAYTETPIHTFRGSPTDGAQPMDAVTLEPNGDVLGTTQVGGTQNHGTVFRLRPTASGYALHVIHSFGGFHAGDGSGPVASVLIDHGKLFGTTLNGGTPPRVCSCGTIFDLSPR
jgi:uncharacterized repeat protein (TIGR03803 family)